MAELSVELSRRVYRTAKAVCGFVAARFGRTYTPHAMARLLGRIGYVWKRPKVVPAKADAEAQRSFLDGVLLPLMAAAEADRPPRCGSWTRPTRLTTPTPRRAGSGVARGPSCRATMAG